MDTGILTACLLGAVLAAGLVRATSRGILPSAVMPFAALSPEARETILRKKTRLRGLALALFILAALTMFSVLPRGITLALAIAGFFCQYLVFRLRRLYPMRPIELSALPAEGQKYKHAAQGLARRQPLEDR
ncbi:MAG: hypothetical protein LBS65_10200 [Desulfovibrio sp.]|jgi:hypothetical protein|nr:hypothetical protein [Desulfovibrio sp.]